MMKRSPLFFALSGMLLTAACSSSHHDHANDEKRENAGKAIIQAMDVNGDGQISWQENQQYFDRLFTRLDVNHDGFISAQEFAAMHNDPVFVAMPLQKLEISFVMFDRNNQGKLSHEDFETMGDRIFAILDRNMDGVVSQSDFTSEQNCSHDSSQGQSGGRSRRGGGMGGF